MQKVRSTMVLTELIPPIAAPLTLKRFHKDVEPMTSSHICKKAKVVVEDEKPMPPPPPRSANTNKAMVVSALLQLKSGSSGSPMVQWTKLFDEVNSSGDDECSSEDEEAENNIVRALVKAAFSKKLRRVSPALARLAGIEQQHIKPDDFLQNLLAADGKRIQYAPASSLTGFFADVTDEFVKGYTMDVVTAVRDNDVDTLRRLHAEGRTMLCGSKFGDSIVHLACRRNCADVLHFLLCEVGLSPRLVCDFGRTPLHDALWVSQPNETIVKMLLKACPDLLYITDKRGSTPLAYLPKAHWPEMCQLLEQMDTSSLVPRTIHP